MTEMNLEVNLNLTLSKTIEDGKILTPIYGADHTGLVNLGNSCYLNSIVQILFSLETFKSQFLDDSFIHLTTCLDNPEECFRCQISKIMYGLHSGQYSAKQTRVLPKLIDDINYIEEVEEFQNGIKPYSFKYFFAKNNPEFTSNKQQDAFEYLSYLFDKFEFYLKNEYLRLDFEFELESRFECHICHGVKYKTQKTWYLPISVPNWENKKDENSKCTLEECLEKFLTEEVLTLDCPKCNHKSEFTKTLKIKNYPKYFILVFQRFVYEWVPIKLEVQMNINKENIDLKALSRNHSKQYKEIILEDEKEVVTSEIEVEPYFDQEKLNLLIMNGIPELAAKHALLESNNNSDDALMWFFNNLENDIINQPIPKIKKNQKKENDENFGIPSSSIDMLMGMGFNKTQAIGALKKSNDNPDRALDFLFENPDYDFEVFLNNLKNVKLEKSLDLVEINKNNSDLYDLYGNFFFKI